MIGGCPKSTVEIARFGFGDETLTGSGAGACDATSTDGKRLGRRKATFVDDGTVSIDGTRVVVVWPRLPASAAVGPRSSRRKVAASGVPLG